MDLNAYLKTTGMTQEQFAAAIRVSQSLINHWVRRVALPPPTRCVEIERYTGGRVTRLDLRPDDWRETWPELAWPLAWSGWGCADAVPLAAMCDGQPGDAQGLCAARVSGDAEISASVGTSNSP